MSDSVVSRLVAASSTATPVAQVVIKKPDLSKSEDCDWASLLGDGSVRSFRLTVGEVSDTFAQAGHPDFHQPETTNPSDRFIEFYVAPVSVPTIGRSLLADARYERMQKKLKLGQRAIVVAGDGSLFFQRIRLCTGRNF